MLEEVASRLPVPIRPVGAYDPYLMRIAYICYRDAFSPDGVVKKINMQARSWRKAGHEVGVFCLSPQPAGNRPQELEGLVLAMPSSRRRFGVTRALFKRAQAYAPDLVYLRYDFYLPPPVGLLRATPTALEVNTDDASEWAIRSRRAALYLRPNRQLIFAHTDGFVCVTHELARSRAVARLGRPTAVIANGIDPAAAPPLPAPRNDRPRVAFVGHSGLPWHGVDKIVWLAGSLPGVDFDIVGYEAQEAPPAPSNVTFHGFLTQEEYGPILAKADAGVGTLALHRKSMDEASPLKVREYLMSGIPTITAYDDTDFLDADPWFMLRLPNTEDNVRSHLHEVVAFLDRIRGHRVPRGDVLQRLSSESKERRRLDFLETLVTRKPRELTVGARDRVRLRP